MKILLKVLEIIVAIMLWIGVVFLTFELIDMAKNMDPWGLTFAFAILPVGGVTMLFLCLAVLLTIVIFKGKNKKVEEKKNE